MRDPRPALRRAGESASRGARTVLSPTGLRGAGTEVAWVATHLALYPLGFRGDRAETRRDELERFTLDALPPVQRGLLMGDVVAAGTPILLVHGLVDNRSVFALLRRALRRRGFGLVRTVNYSPFTHDVQSAAHQLARLVEQVCEETGYEKVHVVGHSLGGVVARYYVQRLGGDERVHTLCTLGTPHAGTLTAHLMPTPLVRQLRPGSALMAELAEPAPDCRTRFVAFWSDLDQVIVPPRAARLDHPDLRVRNVLLRGVGHTSLPIDRRVIREITGLLAHLDEDGATVAEAVVPLDAPAPEAPARRSRGRRAPRDAGVGLVTHRDEGLFDEGTCG